MSRQTHLNKSGSGFAAKTACGRNILRAPMSCGWAGFKLLPESLHCSKCADSKQASLNAKRDADLWVPEDQEAWKAADDAVIAARRDWLAAVADYNAQRAASATC